MNNEPVAWGMLDSEGGIYDSINPKEHDREEGAYTIPLYTHPAKTLTDEEIKEVLLSNTRMSMCVWLSSNITKEEVEWFARAILKKASEK